MTLRSHQLSPHSTLALFGLFVALPLGCASKADDNGSVSEATSPSGTGAATNTAGNPTTAISGTGAQASSAQVSTSSPSGSPGPVQTTPTAGSASATATSAQPTAQASTQPTSNTTSSGGAGGGDNANTSGGAGGGDGGAAAGSGGAGGAPVEPGNTDEPLPSMGCGETPPESMRYSIDVDGTMREYILRLPEDYDPEKAYRLVFTWHPWGGSAQQVAGNGSGGYYGLASASGGEAILVSPEGLDFGGNGLGWGNEGGGDIAFLRAMLDRFDAEFCFDHNRTFSTGFSFGGMMSNAVACSGLARPIAPMAGNSSVSRCEAGTQPVAYMGFHGVDDSVVDVEGGRTARDEFVERNGCGAVTPSDSNWCEVAGGNYQPCECTTYEGCTAGYPVTWCEFKGDHMVAPNSGETIWNFFAQF